MVVKVRVKHFSLVDGELFGGFSEVDVNRIGVKVKSGAGSMV